MASNLNKDPIFALNFIRYHMTRTERRLAELMAECRAEFENGIRKKVNPSIGWLAKKVGCDRKTVERFLKKYHDVLFFVHSGKKDHKKNVYEIFDNLFEVMSYLSPKGFIKNWKRNEKWIKEEIITYEDFRLRKLGLSTMKCRSANKPKCRTLKTLNSSQRHINICTQERTQSYEQKQKKEGLRVGKSVMFLKEVGIPEKEALRINSWYSNDAWFEARKDFHWFQKRQTIYNPLAFMISRAKEHTKRLFKI